MENVNSEVKDEQIQEDVVTETVIAEDIVKKNNTYLKICMYVTGTVIICSLFIKIIFNYDEFQKFVGDLFTYYVFRLEVHKGDEMDFEFKIDQAMCASAMNTNAKAIYCFTKTSNTPRIITSFTPQCPIVAITKNKKLQSFFNPHPL